MATLGGCAAGRSKTDDGASSSPVPQTEFSCPADPSVVTGSASTSPSTRRLQIVTSVAPITSIVANIAGDRADVHGVIPEGTNSHTYEPKPSVAATVTDADLVVVNGLQLEDPLEEIAEHNLRDGASVVELGTKTIDPDQYIYDFSFPRDGGKPNPHLWTNPPMARCYAAIAAGSMAGADPANADYYLANYRAFAARIDQLDALMQAATASVPSGNRLLLTYHDAYAYFADHYGYRVIGAIQVSSFEDPTPKEVARLIEQVRQTGVPAIFGSEVFPSPVLDQIAAEAGVSYVDTLRDDDLPGRPGEPDHSYLGLMKADFVTMVSSLGGDASDLAQFDPSDVVTDHAEYAQ